MLLCYFTSDWTLMPTVKGAGGGGTLRTLRSAVLSDLSFRSHGLHRRVSILEKILSIR